MHREKYADELMIHEAQCFGLEAGSRQCVSQRQTLFDQHRLLSATRDHVPDLNKEGNQMLFKITH